MFRRLIGLGERRAWSNVAHRFSSTCRTCGLPYTLGQPSTPEVLGVITGRPIMFQMIDQSSADTGDRKLLLYKIGMFIVALAAVGGVVFLCLRSLS